MSRHASLRSSCTAVLLIAFAAVAHAAPRATADPWPRYRAEGPGPESDSRDRRGFLLGGLGFWSDSSELLSSSWGVGGGVTLPVNTWSVVPRLDWEGGSDEYASGWMVRSTLGGRVPTGIGSRHTYLEGGIGIAHFETTVRGESGSGRQSRVHSGTRPCFELASGLTSDPDARPGFILEAQTVFANGSDAPSVLLGRVGILF